MNSNVGRIIKLKQIEIQITQEELSKDICTPSYLSKIENNIVKANETIYKMLFNKLGIQYVNERETKMNSEVLDEKIENWYLNMLEGGNKKENYYELKQQLSNLNNEVLLIKFNIVYSRYLLGNGEIERAAKILNQQKHVIKLSNNRLYFLYINVMMMLHYLNEDFQSAIEEGLHFTELIDYHLIANEFELGIFYYNMALNYNYIYSNENSLNRLH